MIRAFTVTFDNSKRRKPNVPFQSYTAEGVLFSSGHAIIDTQFAPRPDYASFDAMTEELNWWGKCDVTWMDEPVDAGERVVTLDSGQGAWML